MRWIQHDACHRAVRRTCTAFESATLFAARSWSPSALAARLEAVHGVTLPAPLRAAIVAALAPSAGAPGSALGRVLRCSALHGPGVALVGDAGHPVTGHMGQVGRKPRARGTAICFVISTGRCRRLSLTISLLDDIALLTTMTFAALRLPPACLLPPSHRAGLQHGHRERPRAGLLPAALRGRPGRGAARLQRAAAARRGGHAAPGDMHGAGGAGKGYGSGVEKPQFHFPQLCTKSTLQIQWWPNRTAA